MTELSVCKMDCRVANHPPPIPVMSARTSHLRLFAVNLLRTALRGATAADRGLRDRPPGARSRSSTGPDDASPEEWCIQTLVAQLNGDEPTVASAALVVLEEATLDERCLRTLVS